MVWVFEISGLGFEHVLQGKEKDAKKARGECNFAAPFCLAMVGVHIRNVAATAKAREGRHVLPLSISSRIRMHGIHLLACAKRSRTAASLSPRYRLNSSGHFTATAVTGREAARLCASIVFPHPVGPVSRTPPTGETPSRSNEAGSVYCLRMRTSSLHFRAWDSGFP